MKTQLSKMFDFIGSHTVAYGLIVVVLGFVSFFFDLAIAMLTQRFFMATGLVKTGGTMPLGIDLHSPYIEGVLLVLAGLLRALTIWANGYYAGKCQIQVETEKRHMLSRWAIMHGGQEIGQVMSYFNDIVIGAAVSIGNIFYVFSRLILMGGIFLVLVLSSIQMTLLVVGVIILFAPLQMIIDRIVSRNSKQIQGSLANGVSLLSRAVKNNLYISLHNLMDQEISHVNREVDQYGQASIRYYALSYLRASIPQVLGLAVVVIIAIQGSIYFPDNPASMIAYLYMVLRLFQVLADLARVSGNLRLNYPRISLLYKWWAENISGSDLGKTALINDGQDHHLVGWRAEGLSFVWPNGKETAIHNLNFEIKPGTIAMIIGPSGAGKTTLFHLLLGLLSPTQGHLTLLHQDGGAQDIHGRINQVISYVGSDPFLIAGTVRDQLLSGHVHSTDAELEEVLRRVHADFVFEFKDGLNHILTEQGQGLSAGQKQRLALARALLRKPSVLLLDEATANLDQHTESGIVGVINSLKGQMTIVVVSHRPHPDLQVDVNIKLDVVP
ncbi:MAG: hypothetical protein AUJ12_07890 [Alphaproteobacteria bacterium CG1_02_46_17]|nr:MAG: hypothetical protein AUJ12_07890 [Alphaproteobacteria bacterium CG1_02_46_17]